MKGIKQRFDKSTGRRPTPLLVVDGGRVREKDVRFINFMQNIETGWEIRVTADDAALEEYRAYAEKRPSDVVLLEDEAAIDAAAEELHDDQPVIENEALLVEYIRQASVDITDVGSKSGRELARALMKKGCPGIKCRKKPESATTVRQRLEADSATTETTR